MCSIRKMIVAGAAFLAAGVGGGGCQRVTNQTPVRLNDRPLVVDEAMQRRNWELTDAEYPNGAVRAGSTGFRYEVNPDNNSQFAGVEDQGLFIVQTLLLPITLPSGPSKQVYHGAQTPPTHAAVPPVE
ncbi:MAG TPA: hypothetical protein VIL86_11605 [Tepidisphaeraceae bacterium]